MNHSAKKILSLVLCLAMLVGIFPAFALRAAATEITDTAVTDAAEETTAPAEDPGVSAQADEPQPESAVVEGATSSETREVYVLVSSVSAAGDYLFVSANSDTTSANMLTAQNQNNVTNTNNVTVTTATNAAGNSVTYIEDPTANAIWTASASGSNNGWRLYNAGTERYLRYSNSSLGTNGQQNNATTWYSGTNTLYRTNSTRYVRFNDGSWGTSSSSATVYIYQKQNVEFPITVNGTYTVTGEDVNKIVAEGTTAALSSSLTFAPADGGESTVTDTSATAVYEVYSDETSIINGISGNTLTFTGKAGEAIVKVTYTLTFGEQTYTTTDYITVTATEPTYYLEITHEDQVVTETLTVKSVTSNTTLQLGRLLTYEDVDGVQTVTPSAENIKWASSNTAIAAVDNNGLVSFTGVNGKLNITVTYTVNGKEYTDTIVVSASTTAYFVPEDGTNDFPEYPNEGAIRIDKTAQAVGNFSETGVAKVELSMTGVPYSTNNEIDVVIMVDMSTSMLKSNNDIADRVTPAKNAVIAALEAIVKNEDGSYNNNRVAIYTFAETLNPSGNGYCDLKTFNADSVASMTTTINDWDTAGGTDYEYSLQKCQQVLSAAKSDGIGDNRQQFCIFITDGSPSTGFSYLNDQGGVTNMNIYEDFTDAEVGTRFVPRTEYYSYRMKQDDVSVYTIGVQMFKKSGNTTTEATNAKTLLKQIAGTKDGNATTEANSGYARFVETDVSVLTTIFQDIVNEIKQAATDVTVTDKITDDYTLILEAPNAEVAAQLPAGTELSIDVLQYTLDENKNRTGTPTVIESVKLTDTAKVTLDADGNIASINADTFTYDAATHTIVWKADKLDTKELALSYYVYLEKSAGYEAEEQTAAGTYPTNEYAYITYTNHLDHPCQKYFPKPQLTWNGAQVSYTFYLVNDQGQPVNRAGRVIPFAEAVYVTDIYTESVTWDTDEDKQLDANLIAEELLPEVYDLYDGNTAYTINVYEDEEGKDLGNHFIIAAENVDTNGNSTTKVFNTKAGTIYSAPGTYDKDEVFTGFDFANTTVAFAVVWKDELAEDTVVIDYGLDVVIDVTTNDALEAKVVGVRADQPNAVINSGNITPAKAQSAEVKLNNVLVGTASVENQASVRFSLDKDNGMQFTAPVTFYYESEASYYDSSNVLTTADLYSSVTVIPATTIYYEDDFLELTSYTKGTDGTFNADAASQWTTAGTRVNDTQDQDRPGASQISADIDADNNYGYDSAYETLSTHSMGSGAKISVNANTRGEATFTFYGTGFDVIGMTSNTTGSLIVQLYEGATATGTAKESVMVSTYYGYTRNADGEWVVSNNDPNALYQVPVMKMSGLTYGQYTVKIIAGYNDLFNHTAGEGNYDLYLDAIRIYDPTGNQNDTANDAYVADGEGWPEYTELRNNIIAASNYTVTENEDGTVTVSGTNLSGAIFIDSDDSTTSIADYVSYGPNNELYLAAGQSVAFALDQTNAAIIADVQIGMKLGNGTSVSYEMYNAAADGAKSNVKTGVLNTASDLYYSIKDLASGNIVITNNGDGILSITNIKVTYTQDPNGASEQDDTMATSLYVDEEVATAAVMSLRRMPVVEEPEVTEPETEATEPETEVTEPETEATEPETEATEPETEPETEPGKNNSGVGTVIRIIKKLFGWLFG